MQSTETGLATLTLSTEPTLVVAVKKRCFESYWSRLGKNTVARSWHRLMWLVRMRRRSLLPGSGWVVFLCLDDVASKLRTQPFVDPFMPFVSLASEPQTSSCTASDCTSVSWTHSRSLSTTKSVPIICLYPSHVRLLPSCLPPAYPHSQHQLSRARY
jgi:hypothetical protein